MTVSYVAGVPAALNFQRSTFNVQRSTVPAASAELALLPWKLNVEPAADAPRRSQSSQLA